MVTRFATLVALSLLIEAPSLQAQQARRSAENSAVELNDSEFASLVKQWTTKPEFMSPLVDHLPKRAGVPTPKDVLGYHVGAPKKLTDTAGQQRFFAALEKALPGRVRTMSAGKSEEGRDIQVVFISSETNLKSLETNRQNMKRLADPRGLSAADAAKLIASTKPHYHVTAGLHSAETSPPESVIELGYRLAVSEEPYIQQIRDNVIVSIAPTADLDGRDRAVDWYYAYKIDEAGLISGIEVFWRDRAPDA